MPHVCPNTAVPWGALEGPGRLNSWVPRGSMVGRRDRRGHEPGRCGAAAVCPRLLCAADALPLQAMLGMLSTLQRMCLRMFVLPLRPSQQRQQATRISTVRGFCTSSPSAHAMTPSVTEASGGPSEWASPAPW
eukprot:Skav228924  [mRNA]  locus=scaffold3800:104484:114007:+ [translate_table: standard]